MSFLTLVRLVSRSPSIQRHRRRLEGDLLSSDAQDVNVPVRLRGVRVHVYRALSTQRPRGNQSMCETSAKQKRVGEDPFV